MGQNTITDGIITHQNSLIKTFKTISPCCGLFTIQSISVIFITFDILLLSHSLTFTIINYISGETKYLEIENVLTIIIEYYLLLPLLIIQSVWLITSFLALISIKMNIPYLQLPYLITCGFITVVLIVFILKSVKNYQNNELQIYFIIIIVIFNVFLIAHVVFLYFKCICFRIMLRKRNVSFLNFFFGLRYGSSDSG